MDFNLKIKYRFQCEIVVIDEKLFEVKKDNYNKREREKEGFSCI